MKNEIYKRTFWGWKPEKKKNIELHENFTGFYKKGIEALYEIQTP